MLISSSSSSVYVLEDTWATSYSISSCVLAVLLVYDIKPPVDDQENNLKNSLRYPAPFRCVIKPRTPEAEALIRDSVNEA